MKRRSASSVVSLILLGVVPSSVALGMLACGGETAEGSSVANNNVNATAGANGAAGTGTAGAGSGEFGNGPLGPAGGQLPPLTDEEVCQTLTATAVPAAVDLYIILDQSVSMAEMTLSGGTRWDAVTAAIGNFVSDARATGMGVGIDYFGIGSDHERNCDPSNYADPDVTIGELPGNQAALMTSLSDAIGPQVASLTPTYAALQGALEYASAHAAELQDTDPNRLTMVVLASDGFPSECDEQSLPAISGLAAAAYAAEPSVKTYVVGITEGAANAEAIASDGGGKAFIINPDDEDVSQRFLDAMLSISLSNIPCGFEIDRGVTDAGPTILINSERAEVTFNSIAKGQRVLAQRKDSFECLTKDGDGFYFDRAEDPTRVVLCEDTCADLGAGDISVKLTCIDQDPGTTF